MKEYNTREFGCYEEINRETSMNRENYLLTAKLTAILRLANAMDRSHYQKVKALNVTLKDRILYLVVDSAKDVSLELGLLKDKKEFFEIYNKIKKAEYNLNELTTDQAQKTIDMLKSEINLKQNKLNNDITELNILKADNRIEEKNRIFELYNGIKEQTIDLNDIDREDLLRVRKLFIEEAKIQDEKLEDEISLLELTKKIS